MVLALLFTSRYEMRLKGPASPGLWQEEQFRCIIGATCWLKVIGGDLRFPLQAETTTNIVKRQNAAVWRLLLKQKIKILCNILLLL